METLEEKTARMFAEQFMWQLRTFKRLESMAYDGQRGWKLHPCPDGKKCGDRIPGGCAIGFCSAKGIKT